MTDYSSDREKSQARESFNLAFHAIGVGNFLAHHLIAATNAKNRLARISCFDNCLGQTTAAQG